LQTQGCFASLLGCPAMLRFLRKYSASNSVKILYGVLALLFLVWGVGAVGGQRIDAVAKVHGQTISRRDLERATAVLQQRYQEIFRGNALPASLDLRGRALDQLIDDALIRHEASRLGLVVTDDELVATITAMPELQENGRFSRDLLERVLRVQRDRGEFEDGLRRNILHQRVQNLVTDGVQVSDGEIEDRYKVDHEQADLYFVRLPAADSAKTVTLSDADLEKYLADHADRYRVPARVRVRYVVYRPADFASQAEPSEADIAKYYDEHLVDQFTEPEQVHARHILIRPASTTDDAKAAARKQAEDLLAKVKAGGDFAALAKEHSQDPGSASKGGDLETFPRGQMVPEFDQAAFALQAGQVSDVVETPFGFHIIKVEEHHEAGTKPLDAVRPQIADTLRKERGLELARAQAEADRRQVVKGKSLAEAAAGRKVEETPPFAVSEPVPGLGQAEEFNQAAFALGTNEVSDLIDTPEGVYLLTPFERVDAHVPQLADVRDRVTADARRERSEAAAKERGEALQAKARDVGLEKAAAEAGLTVETTGSFERRAGTIPKIGVAGDLKNDAFGLTPEAPLAPKVYTASGGDAVVAALHARTPADMNGFASAKDALHESLVQQKRATTLDAYMTYLKDRAQREGELEVRADALGRG